MTSLIVNADDAGIDSARNEGIIRAFEEGILTSTTVLINSPAAEEIIAYAKTHPNLGLGLHLNLTEGKPLANAQSAELFSGKKLAWSCAQAGKLDLAMVEREFRAQIELFLDNDLTPTHIDGHNHIHVFPGVSQVVASLLEQYPGIGGIRLPRERKPTSKNFYFDGVALEVLLASYCEELKPTLPERLFIPAFTGIALSSDFTLSRVLAEIEELIEPVVELMCHPGVSTKGLTGFSNLPAREQELQVLCEPELSRFIDEKKITLVSYAIGNTAS